MSTKTTFKRIALVAVSTLGFGLLVNVAPAQAADDISITSVSVGTPAAARVATVGTFAATFRFAAGQTAGETFTAGARVVSAPTGSAAFNAVTGAPAAGAALTVTATTVNSSAGVDGRTAGTAGEYAIGNGKFGSSTSTVVSLADSAVDERTSASVTFRFTPDVAGEYRFVVWAGGTTWSAGYKQTTVTVTTRGTPTSIAITKYGSVVPSQITSGSVGGALLGITLKDEAGNATRLATGESLVLTENGSVTLSADSLTAGADSSGIYFIRVLSADADQSDATVTITVAGSGGIIPATTTTNTTVSVVKTADSAAVTGIDLKSATGYAADADYVTASKSTHTAVVTRDTETSDDAEKYALNLKSGLLTWSTTVTFKAGAETAEVTWTGAVTSAGASTYLEVDGGSEDTRLDISYEAATATSLDIVGQSTVLAATGATTKWTVQVTDQYGSGMQYQAVTVAVAGRNALAAKAIGVTDATGYISFSHVDKGTTGTSDALTFDHEDTSAVIGTVNYGTVTVSTITVSGGSKAETIAGSTLTTINAADNGPETSAVEISAVVKDANGNLLAGVPVTFSVDKGAVKKTAVIDYSVVYSDASGTAKTYVFNWLEGKQTITATAGGVSGTDYLTWDQNDSLSARVLSGEVTGDIISMKVVDRFGNPVEGVVITLGRTGAGLFSFGISSLSVATDENGTADVAFKGSGTVTAKLSSTYVQAFDVAGEIDDTAVTAAVAGTTKGTGDTLAPVGVNKISLTVTEGSEASTVAANAAADAAAEAIDAANAATDAANLAAEAADAATVAAEEARDAADAATAAVEELATQVATLMAALKAQITTLANTVAKIAKKVKA